LALLDKCIDIDSRKDIELAERLSRKEN